MKSERLTLLISPGDKAAINSRAELLGISVSELVRQAALNYDPGEDAARAEVEQLLPEFRAAIARMDASFDRMLETSEAHERELDRLASPAYREEVRQRLEADPDIDWERIAALCGGDPRSRAA